MTIAFVQDINFFELPFGGAQSNDYEMSKYLIEKRGLEVDIITLQNVTHRLKKDYELLIISNCVNFTHEQLKQLTDKTPYVIFTHDYYFCNFRLHFAGKETCKKCSKVKFWTEMHRNAKRNIFLSPLHRKMHEIIFDKKVLGRDVWIPSAVDIEFWKPVKDVKRKKGTVLSVNGLALFKGRYNLHAYAKQHPEMEFIIAGQGHPFDDLGNCKFIGPQNPEQLRQIYSEVEYVIMLPDTAQPMEQVFCEAILCGTKVIGNRNIGATSYPWDWSNKEEIKNYLKQAPAGFADEIYEVLGQIRKNEDE